MNSSRKLYEEDMAEFINFFFSNILFKTIMKHYFAVDGYEDLGSLTK